MSKPINARRLPKYRPPTHPGEMLLEEFLKPLGLSQAEFARRIEIPYSLLNGIVNKRRSINVDTALRFEQVLGMPAYFWLKLQNDWKLWHALRSPLKDEIDKLVPLVKESRNQD